MYHQGLKPYVKMEVNIWNPTTLEEAEGMALYVDGYYTCTTNPNLTKANTTTQPPRSGNPGGGGKTFQTGQPGKGNGQKNGNGSPTKLTNEERQYLIANNGCF